MSSFIAAATRTKCVDCKKTKFVREFDRRLKQEIPVCNNCGGDPTLYRVGFTLPKVGTSKSQQYFKTRNEIGEKLDSVQKAIGFKDYIANRIKKDGAEFDPREFGTNAEKQIFIIKYFVEPYKKNNLKKLEMGRITPGGVAKKFGVIKNQIIPIFGEYSVKDISHQLVDRVLYEEHLSDSRRNETLKELKAILEFASIRALIKAPPKLPALAKIKTYKNEDFYTIQERDLVIANIKKYSHRVAVTILAKYTRRVSEIRCLRWGDINLKDNEITFSRHVSEGKGITATVELDGLKSSPDKTLRYDFFPELKGMLIELGPSFNKNDLVFPGRNGLAAKNFLWKAWTDSVNKLISEKKLTKKVDLHRGTRNSTLSALYEAGNSEDVLKELYGGNLETMKKHYAKKTKQHTGNLLS